MINPKTNQPTNLSNGKSVNHNDDENNVFSFPHWFEDSPEEKNHSLFEGVEDNGVNSIYVKFDRTLGIKSAEMAGEPYIQYNDMMKNGSQSVGDFLDHFLKHLKANKVDLLHLHNVRRDAHIFDYCQANGVILEEKLAPFINLGNFANYDEYFSSLGKNSRYASNKIFRTRECEYNLYADQQIDAELVEFVLAQKAAQLELRGETSRLFADQAKVAQLVTKLSTPSADYKTYISTFKIDGAIASSSVFFVKKNKVYFYILAMDNEFAKLSPGNHIVLKNIEAAFELNCTIYDFLAPNDVYKLKWSRGDDMPVYDILVPITVKGKLIGLGYFKFIRPILKKIYLFTKNRLNLKHFSKVKK
ncbi:MAG: GNAT family N-acetyltransferase [Alphaproteobacteria bacterium]|nr:GNAT family N-acetyltransferase [Alphaproteobacteria bacterium]